MFTSFETVWQTYAKEKQNKFGFDQLFMVYEALRAHKKTM